MKNIMKQANKDDDSLWDDDDDDLEEPSDDELLDMMFPNSDENQDEDIGDFMENYWD